MYQKNWIGVNFNEGLGILDDQCGYPVIEDKEDHNGPTGKVKELQRIQAHAGRDFIFPYRKKLGSDIDECPYLHIAIKAQRGTKTYLFLKMHDREEHKNRFVVVGKTKVWMLGSWRKWNKNTACELREK